MNITALSNMMPKTAPTDAPTATPTTECCALDEEELLWAEEGSEEAVTVTTSPAAPVDVIKVPELALVTPDVEVDVITFNPLMGIP